MPALRSSAPRTNLRALTLGLAGYAAAAVALFAVVLSEPDADAALAVHRGEAYVGPVIDDPTLDSASVFDLARPGCHSPRIGVYVYPDTTPPPASVLPWLRAVRTGADAGRTQLVARADDACVLVPALSALFQLRMQSLVMLVQQLRRLPYWNTTGINHVVIDLLDYYPPPHHRVKAYDLSYSQFDVDKALRFKSSLAKWDYRSTLDVALPLPALKRYHASVRGNAYDQRPLLAFFKGSVSSELSVASQRVRRAVLALSDPDAGIIAVDASDTSVDYDTALSRARFALVPRGTGLHSYRLLEVMSAGCVPVVISDGFVLPFPERIRWSDIALHVAEASVDDIPSLLRHVSPHAWSQMHQRGQEAYQAWMRSSEVIFATAFDILAERIIALQSQLADEV